MPPKRRRRVRWMVSLILILGLGSALILYGFRESLHLYLTPSTLQLNPMKVGQIFRLGGVVSKDSLKREGLDIEFTVTDFSKIQKVVYHGITPDLFKEESGVIAEGSLNGEGLFVATSILAKHDENYRPPGILKSSP
jgi:cytochrome c-type biogenesis protein CcmE